MARKERLTHPETLEHFFQEALEAFPYDLDATGMTQGTLEVEPEDDIEYSEEYIFEAGMLLDEPLKAGGWIDLRRDGDGDLYMSALFSVARNGDWKNKDAQVLPEYHAIQGNYDPESKTWELWIGAY